MASSKPPSGDDPSKKRSLVIVDMPVEFIDREVLKNHFERFGTVERVACSISKKYAVLHFSTPAEARNAELNGTIIREGAPPLKIFNRATGIGNVSQRALAPPQQQQQPTRVVTTRRKIVRSFGSGSGGVTVSVSNTTGGGMMTTPRSVFASKSPNVSSDAAALEQPAADAPIASTSKFQQAPLRSSIKISRPSPYLRRKPSYGDKSGKAPSGGGVVPRNPFALPARNQLTLDRRRKTTDAPTTSQTSSAVFKVGGDSMDGNRTGEGTASSSTFQSSAVGNVADSAEIQLDESDETEEVPSSSENFQVSKDEDQEDSHKSAEQDAAVDLDESTEDAAFNDEPEPDNDNVKKDPDYNPIDDAETDTDTQDTVEVTTEEEGEILETEEVNEDDEEGEDEPYESPLKRMEKSKATTSGAESSSSGFSFKLAASKVDVKGTAASSSAFKVPFSSPFGFGDTSKPFSGTAFGSQFGASKSSTSIFAGSSSGTAAVTSTQDDTMPTSSSKVTDPPKVFGMAKEFEAKKDFGPASSSSSEPEKPKAFTFFSSLATGSALAGIKPASASTATSSTSKSTLPTSAANVDVKPSIFSSSKLSAASVSANRQPSPSFTGQAKPSSSTSTSTFAVPKAARKQTKISQAPKDCPNPLLLSFTPDTAEAQELFAKRANSAEERYRILEARDKIIRARVPKAKVNVEFATKLIGTCPDMCPEKERYMRQFQRQLVAYEILPGGADVAVDHQKAIKAYSRSSADQEEPLPHELRPGPTLDFTMHYLLRFIVPLGDNPDENLSDWYNFLWDRTRSIRKDITQQQIIDMTAVSLFEKCARFHIHCASRLCELDVHSFDPKLNDENLMKCIQSLEHLYEDLRRRQVDCPNEPEFRAYQIMMNLNEGDALIQAQQLPRWILNSREVQSALKLHHCIYMKNFVGFFKTVESLPYMTSCILHRYFFQVRSLALRCFIKAHCTLPKYETAMPMTTLQRMLGYGPNGALSFSYLCEAHGIHCDVEENKVILKRKMFYLPECPSIYRESFLVDSKLQTSVAEAINGSPLPEFIAREPQSSFNDAGQLIAGDVVGSGLNNENQPPASVFVPPEISSSNKSQSKSGFGLFGSSSSSSFSSFAFGSAGAFMQPRKEQPPPYVPAPVQKPAREIEAACKAATTKIIEESVQKDLARLSEARLIEARVIQEKTERRRQQEQIATRMASEFLTNILAQQTENLVRQEAIAKMRQMKTVEQLSSNAAFVLLDEVILNSLCISARTELMHAREHYHRILMILRRIFLRLRARFAAEKWIRYAQKKKFEREREEERRREQLWNFPVINSYSLSTKDVFRAFCGRSSVQPSLNKVDLLNKSPEDTFRLHKRKSDGDAPEYGRTPTKLPRLTSGGNIALPSSDRDSKKMKDLWEFPVIDSYSRTNRQVLESFCGSSHVENISISPKITKFDSSPNNRFTGFNQFSDSSFFIRKPAQPFSIGRVSEEIRTKTNESTSDFLNTIQSFLSQVKEEASQSPNLEPYQEKVDEFRKNCPEVNDYIEQHEISGGSGGHRDAGSSRDFIDGDDNSDSDWMEMDNDGGFSSAGILSGLFVEEDQLLSKLKNFKKQVKEESERTSWDTETFLNKIDINVESY